MRSPTPRITSSVGQATAESTGGADDSKSFGTQKLRPLGEAAKDDGRNAFAPEGATLSWSESDESAARVAVGEGAGEGTAAVEDADSAGIGIRDTNVFCAAASTFAF